MKNLIAFLTLVMIIVLSACKKEEGIVPTTPERTIKEKFNSAARLSKYSGNVYLVDSIRKKYNEYYPWTIKSPDGLLTQINITFQDTLLCHQIALWRNQVLGSGPLLVMHLSAYLDYTEVYYNGKIIGNEDFSMMYVSEVRESNGELFMSWRNYHQVWLEYNIETKQWTYQPDQGSSI